MKLITTKAGNRICVAFMVLVGVILTVVIDDNRTATTVFLVTTVVESWIFTIVYGIWSKWRTADVARALFWLGLSYALVSTHIVLTVFFKWPASNGYNSDVRQILYLALAASMLNILLVVRRMQWETIDEVRELIREAYKEGRGDIEVYRLGHEDGVAEEKRSNKDQFQLGHDAGMSDEKKRSDSDQ